MKIPAGSPKKPATSATWTTAARNKAHSALPRAPSRNDRIVASARLGIIVVSRSPAARQPVSADKIQAVWREYRQLPRVITPGPGPSSNTTGTTCVTGQRLNYARWPRGFQENEKRRHAFGVSAVGPGSVAGSGAGTSVGLVDVDGEVNRIKVSDAGGVVGGQCLAQRDLGIDVENHRQIRSGFG